MANVIFWRMAPAHSQTLWALPFLEKAACAVVLEVRRGFTDVDMY